MQVDVSVCSAVAAPFVRVKDGREEMRSVCRERVARLGTDEERAHGWRTVADYSGCLEVQSAQITILRYQEVSDLGVAEVDALRVKLIDHRPRPVELLDCQLPVQSGMQQADAVDVLKYQDHLALDVERLDERRGERPEISFSEDAVAGEFPTEEIAAIGSVGLHLARW
jgi:hypothetical protein